jgi:hypothetical protein
VLELERPCADRTDGAFFPAGGKLRTGPRLRRRVVRFRRAFTGHLSITRMAAELPNEKPNGGSHDPELPHA